MPRSSVVARVQQALLLTSGVSACSNFLMENDYVLSVRTMDLGTPLSFGVATVPRGSGIARDAKSTYGFVGFPPVEAGIVLQHFVSGGMNEAGLSCDEQTLLHTKYPPQTNTSSDLPVDYFCEYMLATCPDVECVRDVLQNGTVTPHGPAIAGGSHFVLRDSAAGSVVVEFLEEQTLVAMDHNDGGKTGFGVMTNEPPFQWQVENAKHMQWKLDNARPSFTLPGAFYPDERFLRINFLKSAMPEPTSYEAAMMQAVHVLNSVTVPMGNQMGTDSSKGEGAGDHTKFGVVYDHPNRTLYWRTEINQNLQRLRLADVHLDNVSAPAFMPFASTALPWFSDATPAFFPSHEE